MHRAALLGDGNQPSAEGARLGVAGYGSSRGEREAYQPETNIALSARLVVERTT